MPSQVLKGLAQLLYTTVGTTPLPLLHSSFRGNRRNNRRSEPRPQRSPVALLSAAQAPPRYGATGPLARMARDHKGFANPTAESPSQGENDGPNGSQ